MHLLVKKSNFDAIKMHDTTINSIYFTYSKLPPDDEQLIYSKHVEDDYRNKLRVRERRREKVLLFAPYNAKRYYWYYWKCRLHRLAIGTQLGQCWCWGNFIKKYETSSSVLSRKLINWLRVCWTHKFNTARTKTYHCTRSWDF